MIKDPLITSREGLLTEPIADSIVSYSRKPAGVAVTGSKLQGSIDEMTLKI